MVHKNLKQTEEKLYYTENTTSLSFFKNNIVAYYVKDFF